MNLYRNRLSRYLFKRFVMPNPRLRRVLVRLWTSNRDEWVSVAGIPLCINSWEESGYLNAARNTSGSVVLRKEISSLLNLALLLAPGDTFVDVGANVGLYTAALARLKRLQPGLRCYAFEANPETFRRLQQTLDNSGVILSNAAVSDRPGRLRCREGGISGVFRVDAGATEGVDVAAVTLDAAGIEGRSIVLKIDVEGHEMPVLAGAAQLFAAGRIKAVFLDGFSDGGIPAWLRERDFLLFGGRSLQPFRPGAPTLLAIHRDYFRSRGEPANPAA